MTPQEPQPWVLHVDLDQFLASVELRRHPELARAFYDLGPGRTRANLTHLIADAANRGALRPCNPAHAADELLGLWQGLTNFQFALGIGIDDIRADLPNRVARAVRVFMGIYGNTPRP